MSDQLKKKIEMYSENLSEYISKVHEAVEGRYELTGYDLSVIEAALNQLSDVPSPDNTARTAEIKTAEEVLELHFGSELWNLKEQNYVQNIVNAMYEYASQFTSQTHVNKDEKCEHDYSDGTGTGYNVCKKCGDIS